MDNKHETAVEQKAEKKGFLKSMKAKVVAMALAVSSILSVCASAADETATGFESVVSSMDVLGTLMTKVWTLMTSNPLLTLFLAVALLGVGVGVFRMIKGAARH